MFEKHKMPHWCKIQKGCIYAMKFQIGGSTKLTLNAWFDAKMSNDFFLDAAFNSMVCSQQLDLDS